MNFIIDNIETITIVISLINILFIILKWYNDRPRLEFYENDDRLFFFKETHPSEFNYLNSTCIVFYYVKIANLSYLPCFISSFTLHVEGYNSVKFDSRIRIRDDYPINGNFSLHGDNFLKMPLNIPPLGYTEGYIIFPYTDQYIEDRINVEIVVKTSRKEYTIYDQIERLSSNYHL